MDTKWANKEFSKSLEQILYARTYNSIFRNKNDVSDLLHCVGDVAWKVNRSERLENSATDLETLIQKCQWLWPLLAHAEQDFVQQRGVHEDIVSKITDARTRRLHTLQLEALEKWIAALRDQIFQLEVFLFNQDMRRKTDASAAWGLSNVWSFQERQKHLKNLVENIDTALRGRGSSEPQGCAVENDDMKVLNFVEKKLHKEVTILEPAVDREQEPRLDGGASSSKTTRCSSHEEIKSRAQIAVTGTVKNATSYWGLGSVFVVLLVAIGLGLVLTSGKFPSRNW
ncbi:unnamed protein product [Amoebophrya sp. A120]|nr:unnamed protein product [Amoebophrya sp. A120]|eukprot:GSA120T00026024001.1